MADKEVHIVNSGGGGGGLGLIAGVLAVVLLALGLIYFLGVFDGDKKTLDVNIEAPKIDAPRVDAPKVDVPGVGEGN
jgi:hypothetical protein